MQRSQLGMLVSNQKEFLLVILLSLVPVLVISIFELVYGLTPAGNLQLIFSLLYSLVTTACLYYGSRRIIWYLNKHYPWKKSAGKRLGVEIAMLFFYTLLAQLIIISLFNLAGQPPGDPSEGYGEIYVVNIIIGFIMTTLVVTLIEGRYFLKNWQNSLIAQEKMKHEKLQSQIAGLQAQMDPHFMFNSLNVLSALIREDPVKAERFVDDFASVYRYMLEIRSEMVVTLGEELAFAERYLRLHRWRFGGGLKLSVAVDPRCKQLYLPPLSLQELCSNAIKHNVVDDEQPLSVRIYTEDHCIVVANTKQLRHDAPGTGMGLAHLQKRYEFMGIAAPQVTQTDAQFTVKLTLIASENEVPVTGR